ncbi:MAG TPA: hypothetical protein VGY52_05640 [Roseiarcus sp.]|jgi:hypothetical protein|nr:hypothetical protein [Roseiarcus sp.]
MWRKRILLSFVFAACAAGSAVAGETAPAAAPNPLAVTAEQMSLQGYGVAAPGCLEWGDGCVACLRDADGAHCSTPGIACQPGPIACRKESDK